MTAYYNEFDPKVAAWLRQLIKNGDIADGEVDERSITDVTASDLRGFTQHHFFAGIGTWSFALRNAGWPDDRPVCTASLPCQPFSVAGSQKGKTDERHLLPHFIELVREFGFDTIIGEQVPGAIKHGWLDDLYDEMERENYTVGSVVLTAAGAGKPHLRQRLYWVANTSGQRLQGRGRHEQYEGTKRRKKPTGHSGEGGIHCKASRMAHTTSNGSLASKNEGSNDPTDDEQSGGSNYATKSEGTSSPRIIPSVADGIVWLYCKDEKYRPIKSGIAPLVDGVARGLVYSGGAIDANDTGLARVVRLKGYGNAICEPTARLFIQSCMEVIQ